MSLEDDLAAKLMEVQGIRAVVMGGSRARGTDRADSDYDIAVYYDGMIEREAVVDRVRLFHDDATELTVTSPGEWGPWIDGGSFFRLGGVKADLLYRNIDKVKSCIVESKAGQFSSHYQPGHPAGYHSYHLVAEVGVCRPLLDPEGVVAEMKSMIPTYPKRLKAEVIRRFLWEADFQLEIVEKTRRGEDPFYEQLSICRLISCIVQVMYAHNERWFVNEKRSILDVVSMPETIPDLNTRIGMLSGMEGSPIDAARKLYREVVQLVEGSP